jgi:NADPH:quinone reductase-like Zn-dependent oxidoreductase
LGGKSILIQNGYTELGLALIELALVLGGERVYATGSSVHHSLLEGAGAIPLGLVEKEEDKAWEAWETLREKKEVSLVIMQEMPAMCLLDMFMSVLDRNGTIVKMEEPGNCGISETEMLDNGNADNAYGLIDSVEKARAAHELKALNLRLNSCSQFVTYNGVLANIADDALAWKEDVRFLINLLSDGLLKPRVHQHIYRIHDVLKVQDRIERDGKKGSIVCLPSKKQPKITLRRNASIASAILGDCSMKTQMEADATTKIAAVWRRYACQKGYTCTIIGR